MNETKKTSPLILVPAALLFYLVYASVMKEIKNPLSDVNGHVCVYLITFLQDGFFAGWKEVPYCMWHLPVLFLYRVLNVPLEAGAALTSGFFAAFGYLVTYWMIRRYADSRAPEVSDFAASILALGFSLAQGLYFYWLDAGERFTGIFSMNPLHNPTHMAVRPFALLCFALVVDLWGAQEDETYLGIFFPVELSRKKYNLLLAVFLFLSAMAKPVFAEMFIPAVALLMLIRLIRLAFRRDGSAAPYFRECLTMLLCAVPALVYILFQFLAYFFWGGSYASDGSFAVTRWMEVWHLFSDNVLLSILCGMAFPIYMIVIDASFFIRHRIGRLSLAGYGIGLLEAACLGESGVKLSHGDFLWPMMCGMLLLFMSATLHALQLEHSPVIGKGRRALVWVGWTLLLAHVFCGITYLYTLLV